MNKIILTIIFFSATILLISCNENSKSPQNELIKDTVTYSGPAKIVFESKNIDLGTLTAGEIIEFSFKVKNEGGKTLKIGEIKADCGCTVPKLEKKNLEPGETQKITVTFDSDGFSGNIFKKITVESNSEEKESELIISALIKNPNIINNY